MDLCHPISKGWRNRISPLLFLSVSRSFFHPSSDLPCSYARPYAPLSLFSSSSVISLISTSISIHVLKIITFNDHVVRSALSEAIRMLLQAYTMNLVHIPYWILFIAQEEICNWSSYRAINRFFFKLEITIFLRILNLYSLIYCLSSRYRKLYYFILLIKYDLSIFIYDLKLCVS